MALRDDEQRTLTEIEQCLVEEDPRLAHQFAKRPAAGSLATVIAGVVLTFGTGLAVLTLGIRLASPALVLLGVVATAAFPALVGWGLSSHHREVRRQDRR